MDIILNRRHDPGGRSRRHPQRRPRLALVRHSSRRLAEPLPLLSGPVRGRGAGVVESVIALPVLMLMLLLVIQVGIWAHAHHVAAAAAQTALAAARAEEGSAGTGNSAGAESLGANAGGSLEGAEVSVDRGAETVTVTVTGTAPGIVPIPGLSWEVEASATGPVERFIPTGEGD